METTRYLNVDCILTSTEELSELVSFLDSKVFILWNERRNGVYSLGFENESMSSSSPAEDLKLFLDMFNNLPAPLFNMLRDCSEKTFDVGFESGDSNEVLDTYLDSVLIESIAKLGFSMNFRIYPLSSNDSLKNSSP